MQQPLYTATHATIRRQKVADTRDVLVDNIDDAWLDWVARALAPIEDASPNVADSTIPEKSRLLEVLGLSEPTPEAIQARWELNSRSTVAVIGESLDGSFSIDLVADGPHGLLGGTTGSGKSEFLQSFVSSLAVANTPEEMNFVLIDYKGGAAFRDFSELPHVVGLVTDLNSHLVGRALTSLSAELKYREQLFEAAQAKDLPDYQEAAAFNGLPVVPRLVIVADEFAALAKELPEFVDGLVDIGARGRSLGIHLILGTQRPQGVISAAIQANMSMRFALRMTDASESSDVIDSPEASFISKATPGRAYARLGAGSLVPFQSSRVGGKPPVDNKTETPGPLLRPISFGDLSYAPPSREKLGGKKDESDVTDLKLLVAAIATASSQMTFPPARKPWLEPLPTTLAVDDLPPLRHRVKAGVRFGMEDHPDLQAQDPLELSLDSMGNLFIAGAPRTGRTTALRTIAGQSAQLYSAADLHIYALDCGNGGLAPLSAFPHTGAVVLRSQSDQAKRLFSKLRALLKQRQNAIMTAGVSNLTDLRSVTDGENRPAHTLVLLDSWEGFLLTLGDIDNQSLLDSLRFLLREGPSAGIHFIITGDRQLLAGPQSTLADQKLVLRLVDPTDYNLAGINSRTLPENILPGRAFQSDRELKPKSPCCGRV